MRCKKSIIAILFFILMLGNCVVSAAEEPNIRVGILTNQSNVYVTANEDFMIKDPGTNDVFGKYAANEKILISEKNNRMYVGKLPINNRTISVVTSDKDARIQVNQTKYRGSILFKNINNHMSVINVLPLEKYLYSVVPQEMSSSWPMTALKAQAIAARSYALYSMHRHEAEGFDVCSTSHCQVYGGSDAETNIAITAVDETKGQVLLYDHKPIAAAFHASAGGRTESSKDVWGTEVPYLQSVADFDQKSPAYHWQIKITPQILSEKLAHAGYMIGNLQSMALSSLDKPAADRTTGGMVKSIVFTGDKDTAVISGSKLRAILGLKSAKFAVAVTTPTQKTVKVVLDKKSNYSKDIEVELPDRKYTSFSVGNKNIYKITGGIGEQIIIDGYGSGHRVGMSQWGAKALAEKNYTYQQILYNYYTEVSIGQWY